MYSPWDDDHSGQNTQHQEAEWTKLSNDFTNAGYREGITAGKESALQEGFDTGYADVGAPIGRELGILRGMATVTLNLLDGQSKMLQNVPEDKDKLLAEARDISTQLSRIRFSDIMPPDLEAEAHAREHLQIQGEELDVHHDVQNKKDIETLEDRLENLNREEDSQFQGLRPTAESTKELRERLYTVIKRLGLGATFV
ncbi:hypothetical protein CPB83DRAFT_928077 [Crepidotus variabilis]|uniref:Protein YAE1 n=1 Tax=Crepidotus variabilis TaxID=179855 RepID=A0A9P6EHT5_9AGAR|nr:hypothetical protein CPB83DRAFT_928077 [Crepidotus variabilis]